MSTAKRLVGDGAPDGLGQYTFDAYLQRGRPFAKLLIRCRERIWKAMETIPAAAQVHILHGMLGGVDGYTSSTVVDKLAAIPATAVSDAAQWLAWAASRSADLELGPILEFWDAAIQRELPGDQYAAFGSFAAIERLDDEDWLARTLAAAQRCESGLTRAGDVARRAANHTDDPRAVRLVACLLRSRLELWEVYDVATVGVEMYRQTATNDSSAKAELRERLLEREFFNI